MAETAVYSDLPQELPYSLEAEQSVLGAVLIDAGCMATVAQYLKPESFYRAQHKEIYSILQKRFIVSEPIDFITVLDEVCRADIFPTDQDAKIYLTQLAQIVPTTVNVASYAKIVREKYVLRALVTTLQEVVNTSREQGADSAALMDLAEQSIFEIRQGRDSSGLVPVSDVLASTFDRLQRLGGEDREEYLGIPTGYRLLDSVITGLNRSDLLVLAARPGMGKTAFALNIAVNVAKKGKKVAIFSLEMSNEQLVERLLSSEAFIPSERMRKGTLQPEDWSNIAVASQQIAGLPIYLDDTAGIRIGEMKSKLRRLRDVAFVVIDYLQLMQTVDKPNPNHVHEVSEMTRSLKIMAKEFNVPVLVLSQLSRGPESRNDKRPMLSDLRESGSIEQDADLVLFLYRDSYYTKENCETPGIAECIVAKNRHGETGTIELGWDGQYTKFRNVELARDEG